MMYFTFNVEAFDDESIELRVENLDGSIVIANTHDSASYAKAAAVAMDRIISFLKTPGKTRGPRAPIGFILPSQPNTN
jgi:hypothetical protein